MLPLRAAVLGAVLAPSPQNWRDSYNMIVTHLVTAAPAGGTSHQACGWSLAPLTPTRHSPQTCSRMNKWSSRGRVYVLRSRNLSHLRHQHVTVHKPAAADSDKVGRPAQCSKMKLVTAHRITCTGHSCLISTMFSVHSLAAAAVAPAHIMSVSVRAKAHADIVAILLHGLPWHPVNTVASCLLAKRCCH
jgi:hypothetical protein